MNVRRLGRAVVVRAWAQQGRQVIGIPLAAAFGIVVLLLVLPQVMPGALHGTLTPPATGTVQILSPHVTATQAAMATALITAPLLLGIGASLISLSVSRSVLAPDVSSGVMESLLATSLPPRALFLGYVAAAFSLSLLAWGILAGGFLGLALLVIGLTGDSVRVTGSYYVTTLLFPLVSLLWTASLISFIAFVRPAWLKVAAGLNGGPLRLGAILPGLVSVVVITADPDAYGVLSWSYIAGCAAAAALLLITLSMIFDEQRLLDG